MRFKSPFRIRHLRSWKRVHAKDTPTKTRQTNQSVRHEYQQVRCTCGARSIARGSRPTPSLPRTCTAPHIGKPASTLIRTLACRLRNNEQYNGLKNEIFQGAGLRRGETACKEEGLVRKNIPRAYALNKIIWKQIRCRHINQSCGEAQEVRLTLLCREPEALQYLEDKLHGHPDPRL